MKKLKEKSKDKNKTQWAHISGENLRYFIIPCGKSFENNVFWFYENGKFSNSESSNNSKEQDTQKVGIPLSYF